MATAAAAAAARARRNLFSHFFSVDAVSAENAVTYTPDRQIERRLLDRMKRNGVVVETTPGRYYVSMPAYNASVLQRQVRVKIAMLVLLAVLLMGAVILIVRQT